MSDKMHGLWWGIAAGAVGVLIVWGMYSTHRELEGERDLLCDLRDADGERAVQEAYERIQDDDQRAIILALRYGHCMSEETREFWAGMTALGHYRRKDLIRNLSRAAEHCNAGTPEETKEDKTFRLLGELTDTLKVEK